MYVILEQYSYDKKNVAYSKHYDDKNYSDILEVMKELQDGSIRYDSIGNAFYDWFKTGESDYEYCRYFIVNTSLRLIK